MGTFGLQPAERTQIRIRIAGLRSPQAAARTTSCKVDFACSKPAAERMGLLRGEAALRPGAAVGCCGFLRSRKFSIQYSRFKIRWAARYAWAYIPARAAACGAHADSATNCGPPPPPPRLRPARPLARSISPAASPQPSGWACDVEEQPSARGRLRAAGRCATDFWQTNPFQQAATGCCALRA